MKINVNYDLQSGWNYKDVWHPPTYPERQAVLTLGRPNSFQNYSYK